MFNGKYMIPIMVIFGLLLLNVYTYNHSEDESVMPFIIASIPIGLYRGLRAVEFKHVFNLYRVKGLFKGPLWGFEVLAAMLICASTDHYSYKLLGVMDFSNVLVEIVYFLAATFVFYRFVTFNLFENRVKN